jgi:ankyrin repeat protein
LKWLLEHCADRHLASDSSGSPLEMVVCTYSRNAKARNACLEVFAEASLDLPDTPAMALHRGRLDLLQAHLDRDPALLKRRLQPSGIFAHELGIKGDAGLHVTPVAGTTLLHLAIEYDDIDVARWLLERGADANALADLDADGFCGHTPLFHTAVTLAAADDSKARVLLDHGANPNARATFRKQLRDMGDSEKEQMREFHNVTPIGYAHQFQEPRWMNAPALALIAERGGTE